jgi:hypothetical protein
MRVARGRKKPCAGFKQSGVTKRTWFNYYEEDFSAEFILSKVEGPRNNNQFLMRRCDARYVKQFSIDVVALE